ncbi:methyltransferase domain-containing protein [Mesorhizobium sp. M0243]|uniref:class I SAM-dependent methyltransferase n=1 Tax=Mesorhizobium sp. M0243 TaxID=2956925 RepID=UPI0033360830
MRIELEGCHVDHRQAVHRFHPRSLRPGDGAADLRALCAGSGGESVEARAAIGARSGGGHRCGDACAGSKIAGANTHRATDLNQPMLDHARTRMSDDPRIIWQQADAQALPFEDARFDAVVCQFGAMFFPDRVGAYGQARRMMRPGGHFLFNVWGAIEDNEFAEEVTRALGHFFPADPPRFMARTPHGYHDADAIRADLHAAGFRDITIEPLDAVSAASSPYEAAAAYCQGTPLRAEIEARGVSLEEATRYVANALGKRFGEGSVSGRIRALVVEAA